LFTDNSPEQLYNHLKALTDKVLLLHYMQYIQFHKFIKSGLKKKEIIYFCYFFHRDWKEKYTCKLYLSDYVIILFITGILKWKLWLVLHYTH